MKLQKATTFSLFCLLLLLMVITDSKTYAQLISIPYSCDFEDAVENSLWELNYGSEGPSCKDQWVIGGGARSEGRSGLYISTDGFTAAHGCGYENTVTAYRSFSVSTSGKYEISFDFMNEGISNISDLYVLWVQPNHPYSLLESSATSAFPVTGVNIVTQCKLNKIFRNPKWENYSFEKQINAGGTYTLMFVWINKCQSSVTDNIGGCIDNIQITSNVCRKPYNLSAETVGDTTIFTWDGISDAYEVDYKQQGTYQWKNTGIHSESPVKVANLKEGMYDFRIRSICRDYPNDHLSAYQILSSVLVFRPEDHCINFVDLKATDGSVLAQSGKYDLPCDARGAIDHGPQSSKSRHTVHWAQEEYDPRTDYKLRTVPKDSYASVRLGNWEASSLAECLTYEFYVDSATAIVILKYAIVFQEPRDSCDPPIFSMQLLDENNNQIEADCGEADFKYNPHLGWNVYNTAHWKDWTTVGLNLQKYVGQKIKIKLTTKDCGAGQHYGYAYFTLDCVSATLTTDVCSEENPVIIAPLGFKYEWTNKSYPDSVWYTQKIQIPTLDTTTYYCKLTFLEESSCSFTLKSRVYPRYPFSDFDYKISPRDCKNYVQFTNKNHIITTFNNDTVHTQDPCDSYYWKFSKGGERYDLNPEIECDSLGETITATLKSYLGLCGDSITFSIYVPPIGEITTILPDTAVCAGERYEFGNKVVFNEDTHRDTLKRVTGCDSILEVKLTVHPRYDFPVDTQTICFGEAKLFHKQEFNVAGKHPVIFKTKQGCDSIFTLQLYIRDEITFELDGTDVLQGPNTGKIEIKNASVSNYTYSINGELNGSLTGLPGGVYTVILYNEHGCASDPQQVIIKQDCLEVELQEAPAICADDPSFDIPYTIGKGFATTYDVLFSEEAKAAGFTNLSSLSADGNPIVIPLPASTRPDIYEMDIVFEDLLCDSVRNLIQFTVNYSDTILRQKWNDVIAVLNPQYNGGYDFSSFQWYKNGNPIFGETKSYIYIEKSDLDFGKEYSVLVTRKDDGKSLFTCPVTPDVRPAGISLYPLIINRQEQVSLSIANSATVTVYDSMGRKQKSLQLQPNTDIKLDISDKEGYYVVVVQLDNGVQESFKIIVR